MFLIATISVSCLCAKQKILTCKANISAIHQHFCSNIKHWSVNCITMFDKNSWHLKSTFKISWDWALHFLSLIAAQDAHLSTHVLIRSLVYILIDNCLQKGQLTSLKPRKAVLLSACKVLSFQGCHHARLAATTQSACTQPDDIIYERRNEIELKSYLARYNISFVGGKFGCLWGWWFDFYK